MERNEVLGPTESRGLGGTAVLPGQAPARDRRRQPSPPWAPGKPVGQGTFLPPGLPPSPRPKSQTHSAEGATEVPGGGWCPEWPNIRGGAEPAPGPSFRGAGPQGEWGHAGASPRGSPEPRRRRSRSRLQRREGGRRPLKWGCPRGTQQAGSPPGGPGPQVTHLERPACPGRGPPAGQRQPEEEGSPPGHSQGGAPGQSSCSGWSACKRARGVCVCGGFSQLLLQLGPVWPLLPDPLGGTGETMEAEGTPEVIKAHPPLCERRGS